MVKRALTLIVAIVLCTSVHASPIGTAPWDIELTYEGQIGVTNDVRFTHLTLDSINNQAYRVGAFNFSNALNPQIITYCLDPQFLPDEGTEIGYDIGDLTDAPVNMVDQPVQMSTLQATAVAQLWNNVIGFTPLASFVTTNASVAFQMAIWEIVWETNPLASGYGKWSITTGSGDFHVMQNDEALQALADQMLDTLDALDPMATLEALISEEAQDQAVLGGSNSVIIPAPSAALAGLAMLSGLMIRRFLRK